MRIREIITHEVNKETGEIIEYSNFQNGLLYGLYAVVDNKTVRTNEKFIIRWNNKKQGVLGQEMIRTNRGWFLDGYRLDEKSTELWFTLTKNNRSFNPFKKKWNLKKKQSKKFSSKH